MLKARLQLLVQDASGMHLSRPTIERAARARMRTYGFGGLGQYLALLEADPAEMTALLELLVVPETWFFRDPLAFAAASEFAFTRHAELRRPIRILSMPCSTGEEAYSLAMAMRDAGLAPAQFSIEAIDISTVALDKAQSGVYGPNAFRSDDLSFRNRYFTADADGHRLQADIRSLVHFRHGNLMAMAPAPSGGRFDIVFCRNLLIYFDAPTQHHAVSILDGLLADGGMLFSGYAEMPVFMECGFATARIRQAFALRRKSVSAQTQAARPPLAPRSAVGAAPALPVRAPTAHAVPGADASVHALQPVHPLQPMHPLQPVAPTPAAAVAAALDAARRLADRGDYQLAERELNAFLQAQPECADAYALLGVIHLHQDDLAAAAQALRRALYLDSAHYEVMCQLALVYDRQDNVSAARLLRERARRVAERRQTVDQRSDRVGRLKGAA